MQFHSKSNCPRHTGAAERPVPSGHIGPSMGARRCFWDMFITSVEPYADMSDAVVDVPVMEGRPLLEVCE